MNVTSHSTTSLGRTWFEALTTAADPSGAGSLLTGVTEVGGRQCAVAAVVPDPASDFPRACHGEVGLAEGLALASWVRASPVGQPLVMVIDVPSQAYGYVEELFGLHQVLAASVQALAERRLAGESVVTLIVGSAISGAFLATGLQANRIIALDHDGVQVQVMGKAATARITRRTPAELDRAARAVPATAYDVASFERLGAAWAMVRPSSPTEPTDDDIRAVLDTVAGALDDITAQGDPGLGTRLASDGAREQRAPSIRVREAVDAQW